MKLNFPLKTQDLKRWRNATQQFEACNSEVGGWFPVGRNGFCHHGVHLDGDHPVHAVGKGDLIAYRVSENYIDRNALKTYSLGEKKLPIVKHPISDNFVLTRHVLTPAECDPIVFYVLYLHLLPFGPLRQKIANEKKAVPVFFQSRFFVKRNGVKPDQGLAVYNNSLSPMEETIPPAAELFFEDPHRVAANHQLHPFDLSSRFKRITGYEREGRFHPLPGYVIPETTTVEVQKRIDCQPDRVVVKEYPLRPGDVLGFSGGDGAVKDDTTVHMEVFIKDEASYTALKTYTKRQQAALELPDDALLNLKGLITGKTITDAICHGNTLRDLFPDLSKILEAGYPGTRLRKMRISHLMLNPDKHPVTLDKLRRLVVKTKSEWHTVKGEYDCLKLNKGGRYSDEKHSAYIELYQDKLDFWHLLGDEFKKPDGTPVNEVYFFHPIKFIEHLLTIRPKITVETIDHKEKTLKFPKTFGLYNAKGNLVGKGTLKNGKASVADFELNTSEEHYLWLDESIGSETIYYESGGYSVFRKYEIQKGDYLTRIYHRLEDPDWKTKYQEHYDLDINGPNGPAGGLNVQRHGSPDNIQIGDIFYIPLENIPAQEKETKVKRITDEPRIKFNGENIPPYSLMATIETTCKYDVNATPKFRHQFCAKEDYQGPLYLDINNERIPFIKDLSEIPVNKKTNDLKIAMGEAKQNHSSSSPSFVPNLSYAPSHFNYADLLKAQQQSKKEMQQDEVVLFELNGPIPGLTLGRVYDFDNINDEAQLYIINQKLAYFDPDPGTEMINIGRQNQDKPISEAKLENLRDSFGETFIDFSQKWLKSTASGVAITVDIVKEKEIWKLLKEDYKTNFLKKGKFRYDAAHGTYKLTFDGNRAYRMKFSKLAKKSTHLKAKSWSSIEYVASKSGYAKSSLAKRIAPRGNVISFFVCGTINTTKFFSDEEYTVSDLAVDLGMDALKIVVSGVIAAGIVAVALAGAPIWVIVGGGIVIGALVGTGLDAIDNYFGISDSLKKGIKEWQEADLDYVPIDGELADDWHNDI